MQGYDVTLAAKLRETVNLPITVLGGGGSLEHMHDVVAKCGVVGVAAGSFFVFMPLQSRTHQLPERSAEG
jgi:cyclase